MVHLSLNMSFSNMSILGARELSPSVFRAIESSLALGHFDCPLLQNLTELTFGQGFDGVSLRDACVFLGPRLKTLRLTIPISLDGLVTFVTALKAKCPNIEYLYVSSDELSKRMNRVVLDLICSLSYLRTISCEDVTCDSQTLKYLSSLPFLQNLNVRLPNGLAQGGFLDASSDILPFLAMRHLHVSVVSIADAGVFLQVTSSFSALESLYITFDHIVPTPDQLHAVLAVVQRSGSCDTLTTFELWDHVELYDDPSPLHSLDAHTLSPLLRCRHLEHITIGISYEHAGINNSFLKEMASAWPCLRYISLHSGYDTHLWHSKANLQGLLYFG
jgi:hypothetical protein